MNVHPGLTEHPKFRLFKAGLRGIGGAEEAAAEYLLRIWAHCQTMQRGENWGKVTAEYVETICCWTGKPGALFELLTKDFCGKDGWVRVQRGQVIISGWEEHNKNLLNRWEAGKKGGRPKGTGRKPAENLQVPGRKPAENPILERSREDRRGDDLTGGTNSLSPGELDLPSSSERPSSFAEWPSEKEWREHCGTIGLPEWKIAREWSNQERKRPKWDKVGDWRAHARHIKVLWEQDGRPVQPPGASPKNGAPDKNAAKPSAVIYSLEKEKENLMLEISEHPANEDCTAYSEHCSDAQIQDLKNKRERLRAIFGQMAKGGAK